MTRDRLRRGPIGRADQPGDLLAVAVDDQRGRHAHGLQRREQLAGGIGVEREMRGAGLLQEGGGLVGSPFVDIDRDHLEILAAELGLERVERRHLLAAGHAPGRPDIEEHDLAAEIGQGFGLAVGVGEGKGRQFERLRPHQKGRHRTLIEAGERPCGAVASPRPLLGGPEVCGLPSGHCQKGRNSHIPCRIRRSPQPVAATR